jgi:hypothetical protein
MNRAWDIPPISNSVNSSPANVDQGNTAGPVPQRATASVAASVGPAWAARTSSISA